VDCTGELGTLSAQHPVGLSARRQLGIVAVWQGKVHVALWQQLSVDDVCRGHLAVPLKDSDVLIGGLAVVSVEDCVCRNARSIRRTTVVDFADEFAAVVEAFHAAPFWICIGCG